MAYMIYSDSLDEMVVYGFTVQLRRGTAHYTWDDVDCVYYHDDIDGNYYFEMPADAVPDTHR